MVTSLDANGKESICWYLDPNEAMSALVTMQAIHASTTLHLAVTSLVLVVEGNLSQRHLSRLNSAVNLE